MDTLILADTDVIIDYFNGKSPAADVVEGLVRSQALGLTTITAFELKAGVRGRKRMCSIECLFAQATLVPFDIHSADASARIYTMLREKRALIGNQDIFIAGISIANHLPLFTRNLAHFERVPGLKLYQPH